MRAELFHILFSIVLCFVLANALDTKKKEEDNARVFLSTFTVILSTVTSTATTTSVTTCTTSAAALTTCSAGRRRRGLLYDENDEKGQGRRGLFYDDGKTEFRDDSPSLPNIVKRSSGTSNAAETSSDLSLDKFNSVPLSVQSGFSLPEGFPAGTPRFKLAYGTSTFTTTSTSVSTRSLTALCASTTNYATCSSG